MARLFIAVPLPEEIQTEVLHFQTNLMKFNGHGKINWVAPDAFHITVQFLGEHNDTICERIKAILNDVCKGVTSFPLVLNRIEAFPSLKKQHIVVLHCHNEGRALFVLRERLQTQLRLASIPFEEDKSVWMPHITVARNKIEGYFFRRLTEIKLQPCGWLVQKLELCQSVLTPRGPEYSNLYAITL